MIGESWIFTSDSEEAAALLTVGGALSPTRPIDRRIHRQRELTVYTFIANPLAVRFQRVWKSYRSTHVADDPIIFIRRAFEHRRWLRDVVEENKPLQLEHRSDCVSTVGVKDINAAASLLALGCPLFAPKPLTRERANGGAAATFNFESNDKAVFLSGAWDNPNFMMTNGSHPLNFLKFAFNNHKKLLEEVARVRPLLILQNKGWTYEIPKSQENGSSEAATLRKLLVATQRCPYRG